MSALGSALAQAGFKGRAQLDKEAAGESKATKSPGEAPTDPCVLLMTREVQIMVFLPGAEAMT